MMAVIPLSTRDFSSEKRVAIMGDTHGRHEWIANKIHELSKVGVKLILQVGDWGLWPGESGKRFIKQVEKALAEHDMEMYVILGNHDDWSRANVLWKNGKRIAEDGSLLPIQISNHVQIHPRGWRFTLNDVSFLSFGGAASIDFETRTKDRDWWVEELPSWDDVAYASAGGHADIMLVHETVNAEYAVHQVFNILQSNPMGWSKDALAYSAISRKRITKLFEDVKPLMLFHGHMHVHGVRRVRLEDASQDTLVVSVDKDYEMHNVYVLDLENVKQAKASGDFELSIYTPGQLRQESWRKAHNIEL